MNSQISSSNQSIASSLLPPPPMSIFSNYNFENKSQADFISLNCPSDMLNFDEITKISITKKSPIHFISTEDCKEYLQFMNDIPSLTCDNVNYLNDLITRSESSHKTQRLLFAFYKLYQEYSEICNILSSHSSKEEIKNFDEKYEDNSRLKNKKFFIKTETVNTCSQTNNSVIERNFSLNNMVSEISICPYDNKLIDGLQILVQMPMKYLKCFRGETNDDIRKSNSIIYDKIMEKDIEVYEFKKVNCKKIIHKVSIKTNKSKCLNTIKIPISLELLLPRIKSDVEKIITQCPFLSDPVEIIAELRNYNYDQTKCIRYFQKSKHLRPLSSQEKEITGKSFKYDNTNANEKESFPISCTYKNISFSSDTIFPLEDIRHLSIDFQDINKTLIDSTNQTDEETKYGQMRLIRNKIKIVKTIQCVIYDDIIHLASQLNNVFDSLRNHMIAVINECSDRLITNHQKIKLLALSRQVEELKLKLKLEENRRRQLFNRMQEQMGNIRVYCRCRHLSDEENILDYSGEETLILTTSLNENFEFDKVFRPGVSQSDLYDDFRPLVMSFIDGYNVCFITYGGEASGKTYTLIGNNREPSQQGIMQRSLVTILNEERLRQRDWEYKISACVVEIYNDNCTDILSGESGIQIYVDQGMETAYQKLKNVPITNEADADVLIQVCTVKRKVARTALNPASSRSHLIILIQLQGCSKIHGENICSFLCLCDLAGFEDIIKAETQANKVLSKEAGYINRSLTAFNRVFVSLKKQDPNTVSYRDTKLTHLLKPFLTNSGKCALIVTVRNDKRSVGSTHNTLRFGKEARGVTLGKARRQVHVNNSHQRTC